MRKSYKRRGWYGDSTGHSLAARGIKLYNKSKSSLVDPKFFAQKQQKDLPFDDVMDMVKENNTYYMMKSKHPNADPEDMRLRAIRALEIRDADDTLSKLDRNGVDLSVAMAKESSFFKMKAMDVINDPQKRSLLKEEKLNSLSKGLTRT